MEGVEARFDKSSSLNNDAVFDIVDVLERNAPLTHTKSVEDRTQINMFDEATKIAQLLNEDKAHEAAGKLSEHLQKLKGGEYNQLLVLCQFTSAQKDNASRLMLRDYNETTKTWNEVAIIAADSLTFRFVQPGNTLSLFAREQLKEAGMEQTPKAIAEYVKELVEVNRIKTPDLLHVGQAVQLLPWRDI